jgi:MFS-type transporter involved in bile tolerance (Atg22 family)
VIRATVAEAAPEGRAGVTFGLLQVGSKLAGAAAGLAFGGLYLASGHPRAGLLALLAQILLGWWAVSQSPSRR